MILEHRIKNGVQLVGEPIEHVRTVAIGVYVSFGSAYETMEQSGAAHLIEHMLFKGTHKRSAKEIASTVDEMGGILNAYTAKDHTCYYGKVIDEKMDVLLELLAEMVVQPLFSLEALESERKVVLEEIKTYKDNPEDLAHDLFDKRFFCGHPLENAILGTEASLAAFSVEGLTDIYKSNYVGRRIVISVAGKFQWDTLKERVDRLFSSLPGGSNKQIYANFAPHCFTEFVDKSTQLTHICLGTQAPPLGHNDTYSFGIMSNVLSGGMSSRLIQSIREELGLAYSVYGYTHSYLSAGMMVAYASTSHSNRKMVEEKIAEELSRLAQSVTSGEVCRAKQLVRAAILMDQESTLSRMARLGKSICLLGLFRPIEYVLDRLDKVHLEHVITCAQEYLREDTYNTLVLGPKELS